MIAMSMDMCGTSLATRQMIRPVTSEVAKLKTIVLGVMGRKHLSATHTNSAMTADAIPSRMVPPKKMANPPADSAPPRYNDSFGKGLPLMRSSLLRNSWADRGVWQHSSHNLLRASRRSKSVEPSLAMRRDIVFSISPGSVMVTMMTAVMTSTFIL